MNDAPAARFVLRDLPTAARIVIAAFLLSIGIGYFAALVQLHFQGASPGKLLPESKDIVATYHGRPAISQIERLLVTDESQPFNGSGSMRAAFTSRSGSLPRVIKEKAKALNLDLKKSKDYRRAREEVFRERDGERLALVEWIRGGANPKDYEDDSFALPAYLAGHHFADKYLNKDGVRTPMSQMERLLVADENKPFNGSGSMRAAFTTRSSGLPRAIKEKAQALNLDPKKPQDNQKLREEVFRERDGERLALLEWIRKGANKQAYEDDSFALPSHLAGHHIADKYINEEAGKTLRIRSIIEDRCVRCHNEGAGGSGGNFPLDSYERFHDYCELETTGTGIARANTVRIRSIIEDRCVRCHGEGAGGSPANFPLDTYERVHAYCEVETLGGGMSLVKLAQTTHVHLLGFAMLYGLTGLIFACTSWPGWMRLVLGPLPLLAQLVDISFWWLGRIDARFAEYIQITGAVVATGLFLQIVLSLFNLFDKKGKLIVVLLLVLGGAGGYTVQRGWIGPYLEREREGAVPAERTGATGE